MTPSSLLVSNSYSMWTSFFAFLILGIAVVLSGQVQDIYATFQESCYVLHHEAASNFDAKSAFVSFLLLLLISQFTEHLSKHWICVTDSAVTFSFPQAARRLSGVFILAALFKEDFAASMVVGSVCSTISFSMHFWYSLPRTVETASKEQHKYELVSTAASETDDVESSLDEETQHSLD